MSDNYNGLITTKQVAGSANIENSCYFVLNTDPVNIDTLSANEVIANNIISGTVEVMDNINLNGGVLTVSGGALELDGTPIGGGGGNPDTWSQYNALQNVNISGYKILGLAAPTDPSGAATKAYVDASGGVSWSVYRATQNVDLSGFKITKLGTPTDPSGAATKGYVDTAVAAITPANWSSYPALTAVDISGKDINNVELITGVPANNNPIVINNTYNLGNTLAQHALIVAGGFDTTGIEVKPVSVAIKKEAFYTGTGEEELGNINFIGLDDVADEQFYANIKTYVQDNTKAATDARMTFGVNTNGTNVNMLEIDGSNSRVKIYNQLDMSSNKIVNLATPTAATDAATKGYVDTAITVSGGAAWSTFNAIQNVNISGYKIIGLAAPTDASGAANKAYVDASGGINWSAYPALQTVNISGYDICGVANIRGPASASGKVVYPSGTIDMCGNAATLAIGQNFIYNRVTGTGSFPAGLSVNDPFTAGDANQTAYHFATLTTAITSAIFTMCRKGAFTNMFGVQGTAASNTFVIASQVSNTDFEIRRNVGITPANLTGGTLLFQLTRNGWLYLPTLSGAPATANILYYNTSTGSVSYATAPTASNWASFAATQNVDMSGYTITKCAGVSNTAGTLTLTADDLNLSCTGLTSVLNINSTLGTAIVAGGAVDITAGGTTAINSTGNVTIGSLGTTSIENFNLNNSVLTKVAATSDLELYNISKINNTGGNIDISAANVNVENFSMNGSVLTKLTGAADLQLNNVSKIINNSATVDISSSSVNLNKFQFAATTLSAPGTTRLFLDDVEAINNDAVAGRIDITSSNVRVNAFEFSGSSLDSNAANFALNNIGTFNLTTGGSVIDSYATINSLGTALTDAVGFKTQLSASIGTAVGFYSDATTASASGGLSVGVASYGTEANNTDGTAVGVQVQTVLGGATSGSATGVEIAGSMTGATKRGFWEHSASANVVNTFVHPVGIGSDPNSSYVLDVSGGNVRIVNTAANPTSLILENVEGGAAANILRIYKNSSTPAANDIIANIQMMGNNASAATHTYANIQGAIQRTTAGNEAGELRLKATINSTSTDFIHIDGSNSQVVINPTNAKLDFVVEDTSGFSLIYADASNQNVMFRNYPQRFIYDICNNYTLTLPNAFNTIRIVAFGAGGGGGSGRKAPNTAYGGGAGAGGNGGEVWYDRRELIPDASGYITLYITPGSGGAGGAGVQTLATNGNNGSAGGSTYVNLDTFGGAATKKLLTDTLCAGGNGGSGGTNAAGAGGTAPTFSADRNIGSQGRSGASSSITAQPTRNTTALLYNGSVYSQTGGSGAGGGIDAAGTSQFAGGIFVSPCGQKYNGLGANVNKGGAAGTAGGTAGGDGSIVTFDNITSAAVKPLAGMCSLMGGGGASIGGNGGAGGGWTYGTAGSRGDGGGGGGATGNASTPFSGAGGRGADGFVYITVW